MSSIVSFGLVTLVYIKLNNAVVQSFSSGLSLYLAPLDQTQICLHPTVIYVSLTARCCREISVSIF